MSTAIVPFFCHKEVSSFSTGETICNETSNFFNCDRFSDIKFSINDKILPAHRFILAYRSDVFASMVYGPTIRQSHTIPIQDTPYDAFFEVLRFIYTDHVDLREENVIRILQAANRYHIRVLASKCETFFYDSLSKRNACRYLDALFDDNGLDALKKKTVSCILNNFYNDFVDGFVGIRVHTMTYLIEYISKRIYADDLGECEYNLFKMIVSWGRYSCLEQGTSETNENIRRELDGMEKLIKFDKMDPVTFRKCLQWQPGFFRDAEIGHIFQTLRFDRCASKCNCKTSRSRSYSAILFN